MSSIDELGPASGDPSEVLFAEPLPDQCPPGHAVPPTAQQAIRLAKQPNPTRDCFDSHAKKRTKMRAKVDPCEYASCSLFQHDVEQEQLNAIRDLPRFKNFSHAFIVAIDGDSGLSVTKPSKHVDLWMYASFDPVLAVQYVEVMHG